MINKILLCAIITLISMNVSAQRRTNQKPVPAEIKVQRLSDQVNTTASDFAPARYGERIYFTSMYKKPGDGELVTRIYSFTKGQQAQVVKDANDYDSNSPLRIFSESQD